MKIEDYLKIKKPTAILERFLVELREGVEKRGITTDRSVKRLLDMLDKKWKIVAKRHGQHIRENGFSGSIQFYYPEIYRKCKK